jgi:diaminohydroxyphosphoribosylaminopyrimidine deaminase/5-amino-6-(5-phosphoribosylamino)uracil reductase
VLDTHLSISPNARLLHLASDSDTLIVTGSAPPAEKKRMLERPGVRFLALDDAEGQIDLTALVRELGGMGVTSLLIEGGSRVNGSALRAGIVDKIYIFYAPKIYGGDDGVPICAGPGLELMEQSMQIKDVSVHRFEDDVMIEGYLGEYSKRCLPG